MKVKRVDVKITHEGGVSEFTVEYEGNWEKLQEKISVERKARGISGVTITERGNYRTVKKIEDVKKGELIRIKDTPNSPVYVRGEYSSLDWPKGKGRYTCTKYDDISAAQYLKKGRLVVVDFDF